MAKIVTISELAPPTGLSAAAVAGGALAANTTYYYRLCALEYVFSSLRCNDNFAMSVLSNEASATTTTTNKSIQLNWTGSTKIKPANFLAYILLRTTIAGDYSGLGKMVRIASTDTAKATTLADATTITDAAAQTNTDFQVFPLGVLMVEVDGGTDADRIDEEFIYNAYIAQGKSQFATRVALTKNNTGAQYFFRGCIRVGYTAACFWKINPGRSVYIEGRINPNEATGMSDFVTGSTSGSNGSVFGSMGINGDGGNAISGKFQIYNSKFIDLANSTGASGGAYLNSGSSFNSFRGLPGSAIKNSSLFVFGANTQFTGFIDVDNCQIEMDGRMESGNVLITNSKWRGNSLYSYANSYSKVRGIVFTASVQELQFHGSTANKVFDLIDFTGTYNPLRSSSNTAPTYSWYYRRWSFNATIIGGDNLPIPGVNIAVFDTNGISSMFIDSGLTFTDLNGTATAMFMSGTPANISVGDVILAGPERMSVTNKVGTQLDVVRGVQSSVAIAHTSNTYDKKAYVQKAAIATGADGKIPEQYLTAETYQGKVAAPPVTYNTVVYTPHRIIIRKYGYQSFAMTQTVAEPIALKQILQANVFVSATEAAAGVYTGIAINAAAKTITITSAHTWQEVYDYSQWWASQSANMTYDEPITTTDGTSFALNTDWSIVINGVLLDAAGKRIQLTGTGTYSFINGADIEGMLADVSHTHVKITAPNLIDGTRVYLINDTLGLEVDNDTVSGGAGYVFVADIPSAQLVSGNTIMLFATYCVGLVAKKELSATGILTTTGLLFIDSQEDWPEYTSIGIDGATVTEFSADYPVIEVNINDPDNLTTKQRLIAWWIYNLSTADGIRFFFEGITTEDAVNYRINNGFNLFLDNLNATPLMFTDQARLYKANGATIIAATSNSIQLDSGKVYSPKLDDMLTLEVLNATTIPVNVIKINTSTVEGSGTDVDPWGGAQ